MTGRLQALTLTGAALTAAGLLFCPLLFPPEAGAANLLALSAGMVMAGAGIFLCIYAGGLLRACRLLLPNEEFCRK